MILCKSEYGTCELHGSISRVSQILILCLNAQNSFLSEVLMQPGQGGWCGVVVFQGFACNKNL